MSRWVEPLERRQFCDAVSTAYTALVADAGALQGDGLAATVGLANDRALITADVKALPRSPANNRLLSQVQAAIAAWERALSSNGHRFPAELQPYYGRVEGYDSLFQERPLLAYSNALRNTQISVRARFNRDLPPLTAAVNTDGQRVAAALAALGAANTAAPELTADLQTAMADQQALVTTDDAQLVKVQADVTTLTT